MPESDQLEACAAFRNAGEKPGLEIWRIEKLEPVKQLETTYGKFYTGDAYIALNTKARPGQNRFDYDLHFWLGDLCSQDEMGSAAIRTVELDELVLGGVAVQYREAQGHESKLFLSYFKSGIRYLDGGVEGGLKKVDPDQFEKRLFQVKGRKNIRIAQVECKFSSLNQGDTFVLDAGRNIYVWVGPTTEKKEKLGGVELAKRIRDEERGGKAHIHVVEDDWDTNEEFFKALGKRDKAIRAANDQDDDDIVRKLDQEIVLYEVLDSSDEIQQDQIHPVAQKPLKQSLLNSKNCYVLDVGCAGIYVWLGRFCRTEFKTKVWSSVNKFLEKRNYPRWVAVTKVVDGGETSAFKQYFKGWADGSAPPAAAPNTGNVAAQDYSGAAGIDAASLHKRAGKAEQWLPDDGKGKVEVWRIERNDLVVVPERAHGVFFGSDCYIILYTYGVTGKEQYIIYFWQGRNSTTDEKTASAGQAVALDNKLGGRGVQIRVVEFKEPLHFMKIFGGKLVVFSSGHVTGYQNAHCHAQYDPTMVYMFQVCGETEETTRAIQVKARCASLNSNDLFVVSKAKKTFVWLGKFCSEQEIAMARHMGQYLSKDREPATVLKEGEEPEEFWDLLGEKEPYKTTKRELTGTVLEFTPRLFQCSMSSGRFTVEEIVGYCQDDMDDTDVMILDTHDEIFIWLGNKCHEFEKKEAAKTAKNYLLSDPDGRTPDNTLIIVVRQGFEPPQFTGCFVGWDTNKWADGKSFKEICKDLGQENAGVSLLEDEVKKYTSFYSLDVLQRKVPPEGIDVLRKEMYLSPEDFENVFHMTKEEFNKLPDWKRINLRKEKNLF